MYITALKEIDMQPKFVSMITLLEKMWSNIHGQQ